MADRITATSTTDPIEAVHAALGMPAAAAPAAVTPAESPNEPVAESPAVTEAPAADAGVSPAPAETPAPEPVAETADADDDELDEVDDEAASEAGRTLAQRKTYANKAVKRIAVVTKKLRDEEKARIAAEEKAARLQIEIDRRTAEGFAPKPVETPAPTPAPVAPPAADAFAEAEPVEDAFEDWQAYNRAYVAWQVKKGIHEGLATERAARAEQDRQAAEAKAKADYEAAQKAADEVFASRLDAARAKFEDFDAVLDAAQSVLLPGIVLAHIKASETGPDLLRHFATTPADAAELVSLVQAGRDAAALIKVGRIEAALANASPAPAPKVETKPLRAVPVSKAPPPVPVIAGRGAGAGPKNPDEMSQAEFNAWRDAEEARRRSA